MSARNTGLWSLHFWPKRIQFVPPPGAKKSSNPKPSIVLVGGDAWREERNNE